ncbi:hypothetical protein FOS14_07935 [Skermania sp. ID1734]|uniref:hypothetical protein n=1 Tax=Skermania sp. ID1734 TaxID=2597516 RepID=UPI00117FEB8B|nr:hypothetical protein [Skermania sp. ID1734]TSE00348.1 hypothetical protein FOS14_07935 [Skermania sp. ID1734]
MTWQDVHARNDIIETVLTRAAANPADPMLFADLPDVDRLFGGLSGVLLALQHRWNVHYEAKLDRVAEDWADPRALWAELAAEQPALRAVLDAWKVPAARRKLHPVAA